SRAPAPTSTARCSAATTTPPPTARSWVPRSTAASRQPRSHPLGEHGCVTNEPDVAGLASALQELAGTNAEEQVLIVPSARAESWHLDVVQLDEELGPRFAVYAEYGGD